VRRLTLLGTYWGVLSYYWTEAVRLTDVGIKDLLGLPLTPEEAWQAYLDTTRDADGDGYTQIEQSAWERLQAILATMPPEQVGAT